MPSAQNSGTGDSPSGDVGAAARQLAAIVHSSQDAIISKNLDGIITSWNEGATNLFGYEKEEMIGKPVIILIPEDRQSEEPGILEKIRRGELINHYETIRRRKDGTLVNISLTVSPIRNEKGEIVGASKIARDITESKRVERELNAAKVQAESAVKAMVESGERFRLLSEVVSLQVWTALPNGELDWANQECVKYFGMEDDHEILGHGWATRVHPEDIDRARERWMSSLASGERYEVEFRLLGGDGNYRWFLVRAEAMKENDGNVVHWFGTNTDVHDLKNAQSEAEHANRAKDNFLATLSHELRTPLMPVLMSAAAMREDERLPADVREQLGMIERNIALEARLIDDLLDLTRISRGQLQMREQFADAHSLIGLAIEIVRDDAFAKGIKLERKFDAREYGLKVDPARFQQVIWNLLRNAVKFTPAGGKISIHTRNEIDASGNPNLHIEVMDSGRGIEASALDQIFLPFDQGNLEGDHRFGGMGLGLAIARAIVDLHGGTIAATSAGRNMGATFTVELPGATAPPSGIMNTAGEILAADASSISHPAAPLRLLLVEDHESTLQVMSRLLVRAGYPVMTANTVTSALALAGEHTFDLVISDLGLPDGTGTELMEILRDKHGLSGIALSGYGMEADINRSQEAGFIAHLTKPVDFHQLQRVLEAFAREK